MTARRTKTRRGAPGATLRAAAAALKVSRKKLLRWIGDGLPVIREGERVWIDLSEAEAWVALNDTGEARARKAALLDPADPRYRDRLAAAGIRRIEFAIEQGHAVSADAARARLSDELARMRSQMWQVASRVADEITIRGEASLQKFLQGAVEDALCELKMDDPSEWPTPAPLPVDWNAPPKGIAKSEEDEDRDVLPVLAPSDPRHLLNATKALERETRLAELRRSTVGLQELLALTAENFNEIRERFRAVPTRALRTAKRVGTSIPEAVAHEVNCALADLGGHDPIPPLQPAIPDDEEDFEDVDGVMSEECSARSRKQNCEF